MPDNHRREKIALIIQHLGKADLFVHLISALRTESYYYASIVRDEIKNRHFSREEVNKIKQSQFYPQLNGIFDE